MAQENNDLEIVKNPGALGSNGTPGNLELTFIPRKLNVHYITSEELQNLQSVGDSKTFDFGMLGICASAFLTLLITLLTVDIKDDRIFYTFISLCAVTAIATLYFTGKTILSARNHRALIKQIKGQKPKSKLHTFTALLGFQRQSADTSVSCRKSPVTPCPYARHH